MWGIHKFVCRFHDFLHVASQTEAAQCMYASSWCKLPFLWLGVSFLWLGVSFLWLGVSFLWLGVSFLWLGVSFLWLGVSFLWLGVSFLCVCHGFLENVFFGCLSGCLVCIHRYIYIYIYIWLSPVIYTKTYACIHTYLNTCINVQKV